MSDAGLVRGGPGTDGTGSGGPAAAAAGARGRAKGRAPLGPPGRREIRDTQESGDEEDNASGRRRPYWWDDVGVEPEDQQTSPHTKGTSAVQFILTSTIVIHTLDLMGSVYVNIFSCNDFDPEVAKDFTAQWFNGKVVNLHFIERK